MSGAVGTWHRSRRLKQIGKDGVNVISPYSMSNALMRAMTSPLNAYDLCIRYCWKSQSDQYDGRRVGFTRYIILHITPHSKITHFLNEYKTYRKKRHNSAKVEALARLNYNIPHFVMTPMSAVSYRSPTPLLTDFRQRHNDVTTDDAPKLRILPVQEPRVTADVHPQAMRHGFIVEVR